MNVVFSALGILLVFVTKFFVNNKNDEPIDRWRRVFEIPADITLLAFLLGIAGAATLETYTRANQITFTVVVILSIVSVALYKTNCNAVSNNGGIVQFDSPLKAIFCFIGNLLIAAAAVSASLMYLGANSQ